MKRRRTTKRQRFSDKRNVTVWKLAEKAMRVAEFAMWTARSRPPIGLNRGSTGFLVRPDDIAINGYAEIRSPGSRRSNVLARVQANARFWPATDPCVVEEGVAMMGRLSATHLGRSFAHAFNGRLQRYNGRILRELARGALGSLSR